MGRKPSSRPVKFWPLQFLAAQQHGQQSVQLARQIENTDTFVACEVFLARLKLAQGDVAGAAAMLAQAGQSVRRHNFVHRMPEVAAAQVLTLLHQGNLAAAAHLAQTYELPISRPGYTWPRETRPQHWRCWSHCAGRWRQRVGRMNGSR